MASRGHIDPNFAFLDREFLFTKEELFLFLMRERKIGMVWAQELYYGTHPPRMPRPPTTKTAIRNWLRLRFKRVGRFPEWKADVVAFLVVDKGLTITQVAHIMGISKQCISDKFIRWLKREGIPAKWRPYREKIINILGERDPEGLITRHRSYFLEGGLRVGPLYGFDVPRGPKSESRFVI